MSQLSGNSCNIITILPLGLDCDSIDASTPDSTNGYVTLYITGGTPPYKVTWDNGAQGTYLSNLLPGDYKATVVDYYGDFTGTTTCTVGYSSFYLEKFEDCNNPGTIVYYLADLPSSFVENKIYKLTSQNGCWISSGTTLYTGETYISNFATISDGPFDDCTLCLPEPTPSPVYPEYLCLNLFSGNTYTNIEVSSGTTINGYPSWTGNSGTYLVYYNTGQTTWMITGITSNGNPYQQSTNTPPTGQWVVPGSFFDTLNVIEGQCGSTPMVVTTNVQNPECSTGTGVAMVNVVGGTSPYTYSLDNINYGSSNIFMGLNSGPWTVYVKDSYSPQSVVSSTFNVTPLNNYQTYNLNLNILMGLPVSSGNNNLNTLTKSSTWQVSLTPTTPFDNGTTITFDLVFNVGVTGGTFNSVDPIITNTITQTGTSGTSITTTPTITTPVTTTIPRGKCDGGEIKTSGYTVTYPNCTITLGDGILSGSITQLITTKCSKNTDCLLYGLSDVTIFIQNATITPNGCKNVVIPQPQVSSLNKTGPECPKPNINFG